MFYFNVLKHGLSPMPETDPNIRAKLLAEYKTTERLYEKLQCVDPRTATRIHPHDKQRILRALGVCMQSEQVMSDYQTPSTRPTLTENLCYIALDFDDRASLHQCIKARLDNMLRQGLLDEVARLMMRGDLDEDNASMRAIAYRQVWQYLVGNYDYAKMVESALAASRQFAKRQLTWMRRMSITTRYAVDTMSVKEIAGQISKNHLSQR